MEMESPRAELESLAAAFARAWNERDVSALSTAFAQDADFIDSDGTMWHGRANIAAEQRRLFGKLPLQTKLRVQVAKVRDLAPAAGVIHVIWSMTGHPEESAQHLPVRTGLWLFVVTRAVTGWEIVCSQITDVPV